MKVRPNKKSSFNIRPVLLNLKQNKNHQIKKQNITSRRASSKNDNYNNYDINENNNISEEENYSLINNMISLYMKGEFGHLLKLVYSINAPYDSFFYWKIIYIKILSYQEIIRYKFYKYYKKKNLNKISKYFAIFAKDIEEIINNISNINPKNNCKNNEDIRKKRTVSLYYFKKENKIKQKYLEEKKKIKKIIPEMIETLITHILNYCYNFAKYCLYNKNLYDCIGFLSLGMRLMQKTFLFTTSPDTLLWACHIYLFFSSLLINNKNFSTAKNVLLFLVIISFKALDLGLNTDNIKNFNFYRYIQFDSNDEIYFNKIFFLISIAFYHLGICYENENNISKAIDLYRQSKYFNNKITEQFKDDLDFDLFLEQIINRLLFRQKLISFVKQEEKNKKMKKEVIKIPKLIFEKFEIDVDKKKEKKFEKIKNFIENLKIIELDDDEPNLLNKVRGEPFSQKVAIPTKNIHILNYLLSNKFNNYLNKVNKIELYNLTNNESRMKLQKELRSIKREEFEKYLNRKNKMLSIKINEDINNKNKRRIFHSKSINLQNSLNLKMFNSIQSINNNSIENNKKQILNKDFLTQNFDKNSLLNMNSTNTTNKKFCRQMSLIDIPKINIFKEFISNNPNIKTLGMTRNTSNNKEDNFLNKFSSNSIVDLNINKKSLNNNNSNNTDYETKINNKSKNLLLYERPFSSKTNDTKMTKNFTINNNINLFKNSLNTNKNKYKKYLSESLPYFNQDNTIDENTEIKKSNNKNKKILKSKSQLIKFNKNIFNKKLMNKKNFLDFQYIRELKFQKELLKCKSFEFYDNDINFHGSLINFVNNSFNKQKIVNDCDVYFNKKLKEFMNNINIPNEREQANIINMKLKKENNKNEENDRYNILNLEKNNEKKKKRRGGLKENYPNHNYYLLAKLMLQINKINGKKNLISLKLKENRGKIINRNKGNKTRYLFSENDKI